MMSEQGESCGEAWPVYSPYTDPSDWLERCEVCGWYLTAGRCEVCGGRAQRRRKLAKRLRRKKRTGAKRYIISISPRNRVKDEGICE